MKDKGLRGALADKGLRHDAIGLWDNAIIGIASTSPAYSIACTIGYVVIAVGLQAPAAAIVAFVPMLFTAFAYRELNRAVPDSGTAFTWGAKAFGPVVGWLGGWGVAMSGTLALANVAEVAAQYGLRLIGQDELAGNRVALTVIGAASIAVMTWVSTRSLEFGAKMQRWLTAIQIGALILFSVVALWRVYAGDALDTSVRPSWEWFNPFAFDSVSSFTQAFLLMLFIYWGWDSCLAVNEETTDRHHTPGRAALLCSVILLGVYTLTTVALLAYGGAGDGPTGLGNEDIADDVFAALSDSVLGPLAIIVVIAVLISAVSSTQTTILPTARGLLAMAAYRALPQRFAKVNPKYGTPSFSTTVMGIVAICYYVGLSLISQNVLYDSVASLALAVAFYYSIVAFSCVWFFRRDLRRSARDLWFKGIFPLLGGIIMLAAFVRSAIDMWDPEYGETSLLGVGGVFVIGIGSLAVGVVLMMLCWLREPAYFRGRTLTADTEVLVPEEGTPTGL
ncbi:APC family permease [Nonomuraea sp. NPDC050328]|uniref:APC family permease n=1 Tax=Nonomuraea sp. NPDC050328 TaxID=3364361 RepID=UPI003794AFB1